MRRSVAATLLIAGAVVAPTAVAGPAHAGFNCVIVVNDATVTEGDSGAQNATFTIQRTGADVATTFDFTTADDTATAPADYATQAGSASIPADDIDDAATIVVNVFGDDITEPTEQFFLNLSNPTGCAIADNQGVGTVNDDDQFATGYRLTALDGGVFNFGQSRYEGAATEVESLQAPIIDIDETPDRAGYWQAGLDGGVFAWNAPFFGSAGGLPLNAPILGIAARPQGDGYWLVGLDGGVFAFGDAPFLGSKAPDAEAEGLVIVDIVSTTTGQGYWLLDAYGKVFAFGDAVHHGNHAAADVEAIGMARTADNGGYWIANWGGKVFEFGNAVDHGDIAEPESLRGSIAAIEATEAGDGYWLAAIDGGVFSFGGARFYGSAANLPLNASVVGIAGKG